MIFTPRRLVTAIGFACLLVTPTLRAQPANGPNWPCWRGPEHNGISAETHWLGDWPIEEGPRRVWKAAVGTGFSSFTLGGGRLYTMGNRKVAGQEQDVLFCLDPATGKTLWEKGYPCALWPKEFEGGPGATPTLDGGNVFTFSRDGQAACWKADSGQLVWQTNVAKDPGVKPPTWGFAGSPFIAGNLVILNAGAAGVGLDKSTGKVAWRSEEGPAGYATPVPVKVGIEPLLALLTGKEILLLEPETGKVRTRQAWETNWDINGADPVLVGDALFISSSYGKGRAALLMPDGATFKTVWKNQEMKCHFNPGVLVEGHLYGFHELGWLRGELRCVEAKDGKVKWTADVPLGSLLAADGKLIVLSGKGELIVAPATPEAFKPSARAQLYPGKVRCWTTPVLAEGKLYVRNAAGEALCLDLRK